jgi:hypothetical protein
MLDDRAGHDRAVWRAGLLDSGLGPLLDRTGKLTVAETPAHEAVPQQADEYSIS